MPSWAWFVIVAPLVAYGLHRRVRRSVGRQPFHPKRMIARMVLLVVVGVLLVVTSPSGVALGLAAAGLVLGIGLAVLGLRWTTFERTAEGRFYTPHRWIGMAVIALFVARLAARVFELATNPALADAAAQGGALPRSPLTTGVFVLMAAYYLVFYAGVLRTLAGGAVKAPGAGTRT